ncbi:bifunctional UGMP family protein/serine/threonine protein kinase [Salinarchaeum sp. Harcht-Bsk1]|uniref:bifunctional N(6)-L-threonylcarbamoyladenine synthase/serine/threonine protein kinase n=1 Tax=Salinarchaeum sp. Harcht-Bsk1 TaxID=1333523 RepID=UPI0003423388|nr:bifunctional N(6)-L-threonylcarbamoyladenine synthase/serine/threonine protein kinase [Salinarchaeum sp. Harcht-Bsk1]AGN02724.1 bifunctional UGMP family protein/serine/threonine protein kinase [Salinarchaeum sp. Harcht-Bsk1]
MRVLGIEGTAWAASAALYDTEDDSFFVETDAYVPESGGIDPRESADHMADAIPEVVAVVLDEARDRVATDAAEAGSAEPPIDAVAFSRGPGLGPCLRIAGTAARAVAHTLDVPLVGVNHMVAHLEIGRHRSGFDAPVCLNASGANAHVLGFHRSRSNTARSASSNERIESDGGRYRVLGETMDTGVGNALDKVARHAGLSHPGGPKLEELAADGDLIDLPYVVKGMDFSFAGIVTAAQDALDDGAAIEDVACSLQETIFAMLTEVAERALSLTGSDELVLGGGVANNARLREMLQGMCEERGAACFMPESRFLGDNAAMIALTGSKMLAAGDTLPIEDSGVRPDYRPDQVPVTWRDGDSSTAVVPAEERERRGAEAVVEVGEDRVVKRRVPKGYRHPDLDDRLRRERTRSEAKLTARARRLGVPAPVVLDVDPVEATIELTRVGDRDLQADLDPALLEQVGTHLATLHADGVVHGDPTTRNVRIVDADVESASDTSVALIDFGLGYDSDHVEDKAMDLHVLEQALDGTADDAVACRDALETAYADAGDPAVLDRLREIEGRGRYQ